MRKVLLVVSSAFVLSACAAATKKVSKAEYMSGTAPQKVAASQIESDLMRGSHNGGYYIIEVYPYTQPLVEAQAREQGARSLENEEQIQKRIADMRTRLLGKNCFMFHIGTLTLESAKFQYWAAKLEVEGKDYPLAFDNVKGTESVPSPNGFQGFTWSNFSQACTAQRIETAQFKVHVSSTIMSDAPNSALEWSK